MNDFAAWTALTKKKKQGSGGSRPSDKGRGGGGPVIQTLR